MKDRGNTDVAEVRDYWEAHTLGLQYLRDEGLVPGTRDFFDHIEPWMNPYKFPEIMPRIEAQAAKIRNGHVLEIGCGMGFDSVEFMRRGVRITATDLTESAITMARAHFDVKGLEAEDVRVENALELSFQDNTFDGVWACGVLHHTGNVQGALREIHRVLKPTGRAMISHFYRIPSWMWLLARVGRENIEFKDEDAPITDFLREGAILSYFEGFSIEETARDHFRALPVARTGIKAALYRVGFRPVYNLLPATLARKLAYKFSVIATKNRD